MAEKFTVYSFQLRPDDYVQFTGGYEEDDEEDTYSSDEYADVFGGVEKQDLTSMTNDMEKLDNEENEDIFNVEEDVKEDIFNIDEDVEEDIFNIESEI